jgi:anti-sigma regulatory factor (Ser/Thr protein kinase)
VTRVARLRWLPSQTRAYARRVPRASATFPADHGSVADARRFVRQSLAAWAADAYAWTATLVVSELATNAVLHARTAFGVSLQLADDRLRVEVTDGTTRPPRQRGYAVDATTGRGLSLLHDLAGQVGVEVGRDGKTVWCELVAEAQPT